MARGMQEIVEDILDFITRQGGDLSEWYVGVSSFARRDLFAVHKVREEEGHWVCRQAMSSSAAQAANEYFIKHLGTDGSLADGGLHDLLVYAYRKAPHTHP